MTGDIKLSDISEVKIPGVRELTGDDFKDTELYTIEVYRGATTPEHTYTPDDDIVVLKEIQLSLNLKLNLKD